MSDRTIHMIRSDRWDDEREADHGRAPGVEDRHADAGSPVAQRLHFGHMHELLALGPLHLDQPRRALRGRYSPPTGERLHLAFGGVAVTLG